VNRKVNGRKITLAHRYAWTLVHGDIPDGLTVDHICENTRCVNVEHLQLLPLADNIQKKRFPNREKTHCRHGHEFSETNTRWNGTERVCRRCKREAQRRYVAKKAGQ
jgi:hypothetical protein